MLGTLSISEEVDTKDYNTSVMTIWNNDRKVTEWAKKVYATLEPQRLAYANFAQNIGVNYAKLNRAAGSLKSLVEFVASYKALKKQIEGAQ